MRRLLVIVGILFAALAVFVTDAVASFPSPKVTISLPDVAAESDPSYADAARDRADFGPESIFG